MSAAPPELQALFLLVGGSLGAVLVAIALLLRSGRVVWFPDLSPPSTTAGTDRGGHVSTP